MCSWNFTWTVMQLNPSPIYRDASLCLLGTQTMDDINSGCHCGMKLARYTEKFRSVICVLTNKTLHTTAESRHNFCRAKPRILYNNPCKVVIPQVHARIRRRKGYTLV
jgi:hypothetical protein